jgi:predicted O-methyltransferase YrrM
MLSKTYDFSKDRFTGNIPLFGQYLARLKDRPCRLLEVGSYEGRSAVWMIDNVATHDDARIDTVDLRDDPRLRRNLAATGHPDKATVHIGPSGAVLRTLPFDSYDFAYIDGCHWTMEVLEDAVLAFRLVKPGGIMALDDYLWDDPEYNQEGRPKEAIDAFLTIYADKIDVFHKHHQVWLRKKLPNEIVIRKRPPFWFRHPRRWFFAQLARLVPQI